MTALQKQVEQLSRAPALAQTSAPAPPAPAPAPASAAPALNVEDTFLSVLADQSHMVALQLVNDFWGVSEQILPMLADKKPAVSQSVCLALLHKVSTCQEGVGSRSRR